MVRRVPGRRGIVSLRSLLAPSLAILLAAGPALAAATQDAAPACALRLGGQGADFSQFRGKVVYVDFWASWCATCVQSFPFMNQLNRDYAAKGLQVVGVNMDQQGADAQRFLAAHPASFAVALGANAACAKAFGVKAMPSSFLIDRRGVIRERLVGFHPGEAKRMGERVGQLLSEGAHDQGG